MQVRCITTVKDVCERFVILIGERRLLMRVIVIETTIVHSVQNVNARNVHYAQHLALLHFAND